MTVTKINCYAIMG